MLLALRRKEIIALGRQEFQMIKPQTKDWFLKVAPAAREDLRLRCCYFLQHSGSQDAQRERLGSSHQTTLQATWSQDLKLPLLSCDKLLFHSSDLLWSGGAAAATKGCGCRLWSVPDEEQQELVWLQKWCNLPQHLSLTPTKDSSLLCWQNPSLNRQQQQKIAKITSHICPNTVIISVSGRLAEITVVFSASQDNDQKNARKGEENEGKNLLWREFTLKINPSSSRSSIPAGRELKEDFLLKSETQCAFKFSCFLSPQSQCWLFLVGSYCEVCVRRKQQQ